MKKIIFYILFNLLLANKGLSSHNILSISFDKNGTPWLDPIMDAFRTDLSSTDVKFNFSTIYFDQDPQYIRHQIALQKPNFCFFPDYYLANMFHESCKKVNSKVVFVSNTKPQSNLDSSYSGVYIDFPANKPFEIVNKIKTIKKIGIIGGSWPGAKFIASDIKSKIGSKAAVDVYTTNKWHDYKEKVVQWEKTQDSIWVLIPFGVYTETSMEIDHLEVAKFISNIKIPTIGFGSVKGDIKRTFNIGPDPMKIGKYAAGMLYKMLKGDKPSMHKFSELEFIIDKNSLRKIGLDKKLPSGFEHFLR